MMTRQLQRLDTAFNWLLRAFILGVLVLAAFAIAQPGNAALPSIQKVFNQHSAIMLLIDPASGALIDANPAAARFYGYSQDQLRKMKIQQINTLTPQEVAAERQRAAEQNRNFFIFRHRLASGEVRTVEVSSVPFIFNDKKLLFSIVNDVSELRETQEALWHYQSQLEDMVDRQTEALRKGDEQLITLLLAGSLALMLVVLVLIRLLIKRKQAEAALDLERKRLDEIIRGTNVGTWEWRIDTGEIVLNDRWAEVLGYKLNELQPLNIDTRLELIHPEDRARSDAMISELFRSEIDHYECEVRLLHKAGHWVWVMERGNVVEWSDSCKPLRMSGTHQDISLRKQRDELIKYQARYDALTGLLNRSAFLERCRLMLDEARLKEEHVALMFVDLNKFKPVNDTLGHEAGDKVLRDVATRIRSAVREQDSVARFGGDEFVVLLSGLHDRGPIHRIAHDVLEQISAPYQVDEETRVRVGASIGVAMFPDDGDSIEALLRNSDFAMYAAKRGEKGIVVYAADTAEYACEV